MKFLDHLRVETADIAAVAMIGGLLILKFYGVDHTVDTILLTISAFYFGSRVKNINKE